LYDNVRLTLKTNREAGLA